MSFWRLKSSKNNNEKLDKNLKSGQRIVTYIRRPVKTYPSYWLHLAVHSGCAIAEGHKRRREISRHNFKSEWGCVPVARIIWFHFHFLSHLIRSAIWGVPPWDTLWASLMMQKRVNHRVVPMIPDKRNILIRVKGQ